jgi:peroxiredoxin
MKSASRSLSRSLAHPRRPDEAEAKTKGASARRRSFGQDSFASAACSALGCLLLVATAGCSKSKSKPTVTTAETAEAPTPVVAPPPTSTSTSTSTVAVPLPPEEDGPPTSGPRLVREPIAVDAVSLGSVPMGIGIPPGGPAPSGTAFDENGKPVSFATLLREQAPLFLVFVRGGWDPFANFQVRELAKANGELLRRGVHPVVVTSDRPAEMKKTKQSYSVPFPMLSDRDLVLHNAYRVAHQADERELKSLGRLGADIEAMSGRKHHSFAVPAFYLIGKDGKVQWSHASEDERTQPKISQIFGAWDSRNLPTDVTP